MCLVNGCLYPSCVPASTGVLAYAMYSTLHVRIYMHDL